MQTLQVKVNPGTDCPIMPLSCFHTAFPKHFTKSEALKKSALKPTWMTWWAHDGECQNFLGCIVLDTECKTLSQTLPIKFYVFEDFTNPNIILSYAASSRLGIVQFTVPNKAPVNFPSRIHAITHNKTVTFSQHPEVTPQKPHNSWDNAVKPIIRRPSQDHSSTDTHQQDYFLPFQNHKLSIAPFQDHKLPINHVSQDHLTTASVKRHNSLKNAFPNSFDTTGNIPRQYTIRVDSSIAPVQYAWRKVPIKTRQEIEKALQKMVDNGIIPPVTKPTKWVSSLTYPRKSDGTICPCLDPCDLTKDNIHEHYKALP